MNKRIQNKLMFSATVLENAASIILDGVISKYSKFFKIIDISHHTTPQDLMNPS